MQKIILDVIPNGVCPRVYVNQYDIGREFQISFKEGLGSYYFQNNLTFTINGRKSDNHIFEYTEADKWDSTHYVITKSGSGASTKVTIGTTEQMTAAPGETDVQLIFTDSTNAVIGTLSFIMVVQECPGIEGDPSESVVPNVVRSVNNVRPSATGNVYLPLSEIDGIDDNFAYTERTREMGTQHVAGEFIFVESDNQLYEITSTINSGGTLTPGTNATACSIGDVLTTLNSELTYKTIGEFSANGTFNWSENISDFKVFTVTLWYNNQPRQTAIICDDTQIKSNYGIFPDIVTSDGRVYCQIKANNTQYTVSSLTGLVTGVTLKVQAR